ncbi:MAG: GtrA family protein [Chloroflexota bacterium]
MNSTLLKASSRVGINPKELERFIKFALVGLSGFVVDFGVLNSVRPLLLWLMAPETDSGRTNVLIIAAVIAFSMAVINNFYWNRLWTYPESRSKPILKQFQQFAAVNFVGFLARPIFIRFTRAWFVGIVGFLLAGQSKGIIELIGDNLCVMTIVAIVMFWNFFVNRYWTYNDVD